RRPGNKQRLSSRCHGRERIPFPDGRRRHCLTAGRAAEYSPPPMQDRAMGSRWARFVGSLLLAAAACSGSSSQIKGAGGEPASGGRPRLLSIVAINDVHGALLPAPAPRALASVTRDEIGGVAWLGGWLKAIREDAHEKGG